MRERCWRVEWGMPLSVPDIPEAERTPLALLLLDIIQQQQLHIARLEDAIPRLKGLTPRPTIQPSTLEAPPPKPPDPERNSRAPTARAG